MERAWAEVWQELPLELHALALQLAGSFLPASWRGVAGAAVGAALAPVPCILGRGIACAAVGAARTSAAAGTASTIAVGRGVVGAAVGAWCLV